MKHLYFNPSQLYKTGLAGLIAFAFSFKVYAGGPWVLGKGQTDLSFGFSRKTADKRWQQYHLDPNGTPKNLNDDVDSFALVPYPDSIMVNGKFQDFRYYYFQGAIGVAKNLEFDWTINWLDGRESQTRDPKTGKAYIYRNAEGEPVRGSNGTYHYAVWDHNVGFTDSWLGLKYQFKHGAWPMAVELNSRFPDLYQHGSIPYSHYNYKYLLYTYNDVAHDTSYTKRDTAVESSPEWRGLKGRDFALLLHSGHSFFKDGALYIQAFAGYEWRTDINFRRAAYADQLIFGINGGYTVKLNKKFSLLPKFYFDYYGGVGNGGLPTPEDRFYSPYQNAMFNNSKALRGYLNLDLIYSSNLDLQLGYGKWLWGQGAIKYTETFIQVSYLFGKSCT